jgi:hypothetical protein
MKKTLCVGLAIDLDTKALKKIQSFQDLKWCENWKIVDTNHHLFQNTIDEKEEEAYQ